MTYSISKWSLQSLLRYASVLLTLCLVPGVAWAETTTFRFCNTGDTTLIAAILQDYEGPFGLFSERIQELYGWYSAEPNECFEVFDSLAHSVFHYRVFRRDEAGNFGYDDYSDVPVQDDRFEERLSGRWACVPENDRFDRRGSWEQLAQCLSTSGWISFPMASWVKSTTRNTLTYTVSFSPRKGNRMDHILTRAVVSIERGWLPPKTEVSRASGMPWKQVSGEEVTDEFASTVIRNGTKFVGTDAYEAAIQTSVLFKAVAIQAIACKDKYTVSNTILQGMPPFLYISHRDEPEVGLIVSYYEYASASRIDPASIHMETRGSCRTIYMDCLPKYGKCVLSQGIGAPSAEGDLHLDLSSDAKPDEVISALRYLIVNSKE